MTTAQIEFFIGSWHENRYLVVGGFFPASGWEKF